MRLNPEETMELDCKDIKVSDFISAQPETFPRLIFLSPFLFAWVLFSAIINERVQLRHFNEKLFVCYFYLNVFATFSFCVWRT